MISGSYRSLRRGGWRGYCTVLFLSHLFRLGPSMPVTSSDGGVHAGEIGTCMSGESGAYKEASAEVEKQRLSSVITLVLKPLDEASARH